MAQKTAQHRGSAPQHTAEDRTAHRTAQHRGQYGTQDSTTQRTVRHRGQHNAEDCTAQRTAHHTSTTPQPHLNNTSTTPQPYLSHATTTPQQRRNHVSTTPQPRRRHASAAPQPHFSRHASSAPPNHTSTTPQPHLNTPRVHQKSSPTDGGNETQVAGTLSKPPQDAWNHYPPMGAKKPPPFSTSPSTILETQSTLQIHLTRRDFLGSGPIRVRYSLDKTHSRTQCPKFPKRERPRVKVAAEAAAWLRYGRGVVELWLRCGFGVVEVWWRCG